MLKNVKIGTRLGLSFLLPALVIIGLAAQSLSVKWQQHSDMIRLGDFAENVTVLSRLVHELQRERGMSQVFLASKGAEMKGQLAAQRRATQERIAPMRQALAEMKADSSSQAFTQLIERTETTLESLPGKRAAIDALSLSPAASFQFYSTLINEQLFGLVSDIIKLTDNGSIIRLIASYENFMRAKEAAGKERAVGAAGLAVGKLTPETYGKFLSLIAAQDADLEAFKATASPAQLKLLDQVTASPLSADVAAKRALIIGKGLEGGITGLDSAAWWKASSDRIDLLKSVEDQLAANLTDSAAAILADANRALMSFCLLVLAFFLISAAVTVLLARSINQPILAITRTMKRLAKGEAGVEITDVERRDEIGEMIRAVDVFRTNALERARLEGSLSESRVREIQRQQTLAGLLDGFKETLSRNLGLLQAEVGGLRSASQALLQASDQANAECLTSADACATASSSAQAVAAATEQLDASIREIAGQAHQTSAIVGEATGKADAADHEVVKLTEAVTKIGSVITLIRTIAQQTNLLALNATIESARAGEAGRGFAVVAAEVKALSEQTAKATDEIAQQIETVQSTTDTAATAIRAIGDQVGQIHGMATSVAAAVEQQQAATTEIARNVHVAATGTQKAADSSSVVTEVADRTGTEAKRVSSSSDQLQAVSKSVMQAVEELIEMLATDLSERRAASRQTVDKVVIIKKDGASAEVRASDISTGGMRVSPIKGIAVGDQVNIDFGFDRLDAKVVWIRADGCGLQFVHAIRQEQVDDPRWHEGSTAKRAA
jgi:methyl-accepting chemotaxis protein